MMARCHNIRCWRRRRYATLLKDILPFMRMLLMLCQRRAAACAARARHADIYSIAQRAMLARMRALPIRYV